MALSETADVRVVELGEPESGAPAYSGHDRHEVESRLSGRGLLNASLRRGELVVVLAAPRGTADDEVAKMVSESVARRPQSVRVRKAGEQTI